MKKFFVFCFIACLSLSLKAQKSNEIGFFFGGAYYIGDLNPSAHFNSLTRPALGLIFRHNFNSRFAIAYTGFFGSIQGIDSRSNSYEQQQRNLSFRSTLYEFGFRGEFNFIDYKIGDDRHSFTPFMFLGAGVFNFNPKASFDNLWVALQPLKTEGQTKPYQKTQVAIPFGAGVRINLSKRIGFLAEWGMRKTFTDYIDDVSTVYADPTQLIADNGELSAAVADRSGSDFSNIGRQRGNPRTKDWYSFAGVTITFQLANPKKRCTTY